MTNAESKLSAASIVMRVDSLTVEIIQALRAEGVEPILLKGAAIASWLYEELGDRVYYDLDLLVDPDDVTGAESTLQRLGFVAGQRGWLSKSQEWRRGPDAVDLHTSLYGIEADDATAWAVLSADTEPLEIDGAATRALSLAARTFHVATHAAQHEVTFTHPEEDLARALVAVRPETWRGAAALAAQLEATGTFAAGLRRAGASELLAELGLGNVPTPPSAALLAGKPPPTSLGISQLAAAGSMRARAAVLRRAIVPRADYMRAHYGLARRSQAGLLAAYVVRLAHLTRHLPAGIKAWREARKA